MLAAELTSIEKLADNELVALIEKNLADLESTMAELRIVPFMLKS